MGVGTGENIVKIGKIAQQLMLLNLEKKVLDIVVLFCFLFFCFLSCLFGLFSCHTFLLTKHCDRAFSRSLF